MFRHEQQQRLQQLRLRLQNQHPQNQLLMQKARTEQLHHRFVLAMHRQVDKTQQKLTALSARWKQNPLPYRLQKRSGQYLAQLTSAVKFRGESSSHGTSK